MKNGEKYSNSRRSFIKGIVAASIVIMVPLLKACQEKVITLLIRLSGTNHILGHRLRVGNFPKPTKQIHIPYLIIGGGISGLSAARQLSKRGIKDFLIVELENHLGGNSSNGQNKYSKYPLGAHYLPLPNFEDKALLQFLEESKIVLGYDAKGFPVFDEEQLTIAPDERLFYRNEWQEGVVPRTGNTKKEEEEMVRFFSKMDFYRSAKDSKGKYCFNIPVSLSSTEEDTTKLDAISMKQWYEENQFTSKPLYDYIDYCCRDDFGLGIEFVSAWAGIHYFAGRKQDATFDKKENVLTWPEGNSRLANHLKQYAEGKWLKQHLTYEVGILGNKVITKAFDDVTKSSVEIITDKVIMASPQFVNQYILKDRKKIAANFHYTPWLLATLTVTDLTDNFSYPLCWDNVIYGSKGLGYVYDQHQSLQQLQERKVITYYYSFSSADLGKTRREVYKKSKEYWKQLVFDDLKTAHPDIEQVTESIEIHLLGHGMISPVPGFIFGKAKKQAAKNIDGKIFFAHTDLTGISIFEEAFHQGINAVNELLDGTAVDS